MDNKVLNLCIEPKEQHHYLHQAHIAARGVHFSRDQPLQRLKHFGVFWPIMGDSVNIHVKQCEKCHMRPPQQHATLFQVAMYSN